jgi:diacylglycerol O-acyltransferase
VMSGLDARFLFSETLSTQMHTIKVAVVDTSARAEPLTPERLLVVLDARLERMPVLRRRVVPVPHGLGNPVVVDDPISISGVRSAGKPGA